MLLSDIFSIPFLICLAICILLIGCSSIYFYQRIMQQDHKIASMVSLISSMAEEPPTCSIKAPSTGGTSSSCVQGQSSCVFTPIQQLIAVSDDDESDSDSDSDSDNNSINDSDSEDYDDNSDYSETSSENDGQEHILSAVDFDDLNVDLENSEEVIDESSQLVDEPTVVEEPLPSEEGATKSIHLDAADVTDFSIFKSINILDESHQPEETSYKKMSLTKLREIAQLNGHSDVSKLKKPELLKLLEAE